ncbi:MAG TPA: ubiquinol-cytochrome c reductase iron-sulfur subunit [Acidobacteriaceae bacterium]|nr:ubiquinol-cytochrome c reductase iron-sulfur subunit [Acidobacteriaceae bacterium]
MADESKSIPPENAQEISRRKFFTRMGVGSLGIAAAGTLSFAYQFLSPNVLYEASPIINVGKAESYPLDSVTLDANSGIYLVHLQQGFFSLNAICTHLGCLTAWKPDLGIIACPCHGSRFSREGQKLAGPAPKPLPWLRTWLSDDGDIMVDRSTTIPPFQFLRV